MTSIIYKYRTSTYNIQRGTSDELPDNMPAFMNDTYGVGNWMIIPTADLPADFSTDTYTIENGKLVKASAKIIAEREAAKQAIAAAAEIEELRAYLTSTDYAAIKCGELGLSMAKVYPKLHAARTAARARINQLEETMNNE